MTTDLSASVVRRVARAAALAPAVLVLFAAAPSTAAPPEQWADPEPVSGLEVLLLLVGVPLALIAVISLLVYVPSMARGSKYTPGLAWRNENEWFGGPVGGLEAADRRDAAAVEAGRTDAEQSTGGARARW